jgi:hypothetical protein
VLDSKGYHLDLLVIHLFKRKKTYLRIVTDKKISVDRCEIIQKASRKMENFQGWLRNAVLRGWLSLLFKFS